MNDPAVLFVDDHPETVKLVRHHLEALDGRHHLASTAAEALSAVEERKEPFDLLILDIHLPGDTGGIELLQLIREQEGYREVPALACTAHAMPGDREELLESGFDAYLAKPFLREELLAKVNKLLDKGRPADTS